MTNTSNKKSDGTGNGTLKQELLNTTERFEEALSGGPVPRAEYVLRLYVTGSTARSLKAIYNLKTLCEKHIPEDYDLEVIDIYKNPGAVREEQIIAAPTLIKLLPAPLRRFVGDLSNTQKLMTGLGIVNEH